MLLKILLSLILICSIAHSYLLPPVQFGNVIRDLYANSTANFILMANEWTLTGLISNSARVGQYNGSPVLGGPEILGLSGSLQRSYTSLPMHNVIYFDIGVKMIGHWKNYFDSFSFTVDGQRLNTFYIQQVGTSDAVGDSDLDTRLIGNLPHTSSSITLSLTFELKSLNSNGTFAINDLSLSFINSPSPSASSALLTLVDSIVNASQGTTGIAGCPSGFYNNINSCLSCHESCQDCFGPSSSQCFTCTSSYTLIGNQCLKCPSNCKFCSSGTTCLLCNSGFTLGSDGICSQGCPQASFMMWNDTCSSSCPSPLVQETRNNTSFCCFPCSPNEYLYANGSCLDSCIYSPTNENGYLFCRFQCQNYIYQNETCLPTCSPPYLQANTTDGKTCTFPCPLGQYLFDFGKCTAECPALYVKRVEAIGSFCSYPCGSSDYLYRNGSCLPTCRENGFVFEYSSEIDNLLCTNPCNSGQYLFPNGSCLATCQSGFIASVYGNDKLCSFPCKDYKVLYPNGTCAMSCEGDFVTESDGRNRFCMGVNGCPSPLEYKYQDGTCSSSCNAPYIIGSAGGRKCYLPCPTGQYLLENGTCLTTCPQYYIIKGDYCSIPCNSDQYFYRNGSCLSTCARGFVWKYQSPNLFCTNPCSSGQYLYENGSCLATCQSGFTSHVYGDEMLCNFPCQSDEALYPNGTCTFNPLQTEYINFWIIFSQDFKDSLFFKSHQRNQN